MKKITILSLHLGYGGVEKAITTLANMLCQIYDVEIVSVYKLYEQPAFEVDKKVKLTYLINSDLPLKVEKYKLLLLRFHFLKLLKGIFKDYFFKLHFIEFFKDAFNGIFMYKKRAKVMKKKIKTIDSDYIISTKTYFNNWSSKYGNNNMIKIGWEHNHHHGNIKYASKVIDSAKDLDYLVLVSKDLQKFYSDKLKKEKCKCVYIPNTLDNYPKKRSLLNKKNLINVGRLSVEKGQLDLLKIFNNIKDKCDWNLNIVGNGDERKKLEQYINENDLQKRVILHGFKKSDEIEELLQNSSIFVMTSFTESFGIVLLEAMSNGLPCVAFSSAEGAKEIISSNVDGYLINNRNFAKMEKTILDLINDLEKRKEMGKKGREKAKHYLKDEVIKKWQVIFAKK